MTDTTVAEAQFVTLGIDREGCADCAAVSSRDRIATPDIGQMRLPRCFAESTPHRCAVTAVH